MDLIRIKEEFQLSNKAFNLCSWNDLNNSTDIIFFFLKNRSFLKIQNCGSKTNEELYNLVINLIHEGLKIYVSEITSEQLNSNDPGFQDTYYSILTLEEITTNCNLSVRSKNICRYNKLNDSKDIIQYYIINGDFFSLRNSGRKTNEELLNTIFYLIQNKINKEKFTELNLKHNITFKKKYSPIKFYFSQAYNHSLETKEELHFFFKSQDFESCFIKFEEHIYKLETSPENIPYSLEQIKKLLNSTIGFELLPILDYQKIQENFEPYYLKLIENNFQKQVSQVSVRLQNALSIVLNNNLNSEVFFLWMSTKQSQKKIKNVGKLTGAELIQFTSNFIHSTIDSLLFDKPQKQNFLHEILKGIIDDPSKIKIKPEELILQKIDLIQFVLNNKTLLFTEKQILILENEKSDISKIFKITLERSRQIIKRESELIIKLLKELIVRLENSNVLNSELMDEIYSSTDLHAYAKNKSDLQIIQILVQNSLVPNFQSVDLRKWAKEKIKVEYNLLNTRFKLNETILLHKSLPINYIFEEFSISILDIFNQTTEVRLINCENELKILPILLKKILNKQIGFTRINEKWFLFNYTNSAYCELALLYFNRPTELDQIYSYILQNPDIIENPVKNSIRSTLTNNKIRFFSIGKTSTYGLNSFLKNTNIGTKTIKDECIEILKDRNEPLHFDQLFELIYSKRPITNVRSIQTIVSQEISSFRTNQGFVWLINHNNPPPPINHKTANVKFLSTIILFQMESHWAYLNQVKSELTKHMPDYQADHIISKKLISFRDKVTIPYFKEFDFLMTQLVNDGKLTEFMEKRYTLLSTINKNKFKNELYIFLLNKFKIDFSQQIINKSLTYFLS